MENYLGHPRSVYTAQNENAAVTATHLIWCVDRWLEATKTTVNIGNGSEPAWQFKNGRDAGDWLRA